MTDAKSGGRMVFYDLLKPASALGVVMFHGFAPYREVWYSGMFVFIFFVGLAVTSRARRGAAELVWSRATRTLGPWLVWCVLYGALHYIVRGRPLRLESLDPASLLIGPQIHLWFLPFAFLGGVGCSLAAPLLARHAGPVAIGVVAFLASSLLYGVMLATELAAPFGQWLVSLPALLAGLAVAAAGPRLRDALAPGLGVALAAAAAIAVGQVDSAMQTLIVIGPCIVAARLRGPEIPILRRLGDLAFGIYLIHPFFLLLLSNHVPALQDRRSLLSVIAFLAAMASAWALRRTRAGRAIT